MSLQFNNEQMTEFKRLVARYPEGKQKSALLPVLHLAQDSFGGWLPTEAMDYVAVLLNITPDHLDRYEYQFENYIASKFRMFQNADATTSCVLWADDEVIKAKIAHLAASTKLKTVSFYTKADAYITADSIQFDGAALTLADAPLKGPHNAINMAVAMLAAHEAGVSFEQILQS